MSFGGDSYRGDGYSGDNNGRKTVVTALKKRSALASVANTTGRRNHSL